MPLIKGKSKKAFSENVGKEMDSGKPQKQSLAIAYAVQRKARSHKKMANGGMIKGEKPLHDQNEMMLDQRSGSDPDHLMSPSPSMKSADNSDMYGRDMLRKKMAKGGYIDADDSDELGRSMMHQRDSESNPSLEQSVAKGPGMRTRAALPDDEADYESMADAIMRKRALARGYADGGLIDDAPEASMDDDREPQNMLMQRNSAVLKENFGSPDLSDFPDHNDSQDGHEMEDDYDKDIVDKIMRKRKRASSMLD